MILRVLPQNYGWHEKRCWISNIVRIDSISVFIRVWAKKKFIGCRALHQNVYRLMLFCAFARVLKFVRVIFVSYSFPVPCLWVLRAKYGLLDTVKKTEIRNGNRFVRIYGIPTNYVTSLHPGQTSFLLLVCRLLSRAFFNLIFNRAWIRRTTWRAGTKWC